ncbi:MAG: hypothetical protein E7399_06315 [Ruminococcaceae bacterium]|nr:hypothetical protein [Oscillospiraceae bacterium]
MKNIQIHQYEIPVAGIKKKTIYHFSDVHLSLYDEKSSEAETERAKVRTGEWENTRKHFANMHQEIYCEENLETAETYFQKLIAQSNNGDFLLIAGDINDYYNGANFRCVNQMLKQLEVPFLYVSGNHEFLDATPNDPMFDFLKQPIQVLEQEDLIVVGVNNSNRLISSEQNNKLLEILKMGKPVVILMHIPVLTAENEATLRECGEYFYINYDGAPKENFEFVEILKENAQTILGVFAGHLHFGNVSVIAPGLMQYVSSQGILGICNRYVIGCD